MGGGESMNHCGLVVYQVTKESRPEISKVPLFSTLSNLVCMKNSVSSSNKEAGDQKMKYGKYLACR